MSFSYVFPGTLSSGSSGVGGVTVPLPPSVIFPFLSIIYSLLLSSNVTFIFSPSSIASAPASFAFNSSSNSSAVISALCFLATAVLYAKTISSFSCAISVSSFALVACVSIPLSPATNPIVIPARIRRILKN